MRPPAVDCGQQYRCPNRQGEAVKYCGPPSRRRGTGSMGSAARRRQAGDSGQRYRSTTRRAVVSGGEMLLSRCRLSVKTLDQ